MISKKITLFSHCFNKRKKFFKFGNIRVLSFPDGIKNYNSKINSKLVYKKRIF